MESVTRARDMRARVQEFDWAATQLGPMQRWSPSLKWSVELVLASGFPMSVRWGPDLIMIYNDAYGALLGDRHPGALGQPLREIWPEIYGELGALNQAILRGERDSFFAEDHPWRIHRYGIPEDARFTISYSPIPDVSASNGIGGVLATVFETTERVRNEKALHVLTDRLESEVEQRTRERDRIWKVSEDLLGVANFDGYFLSATPLGQICSAGARTKSNRCMSTSCAIPTMQQQPLPRGDSSREACRTCASKTVSVTAMDRGDGSPGR
jgi:hypothetical protein